ncbi:hypothetical protein GQ54DRAFT_296551 [Martensiomyces pterosporus]|nr:hypothetical protein GQ54DRAFT_296551 [Martensiomyces pterosporus]
MALLSDPTFLIYQLRISFLRSNDPTGDRILDFDGLAVPPIADPAARGGTPSSVSPVRRRNTSASEFRHQVAQNTMANPYIMACGYYPETDTASSPDVRYDGGYFYSRPTMRQARTDNGVRGQDGGMAPAPSARYPDGGGGAGRNRNTNRNAKVAPTQGGAEEVVGLGVVPQHPEMMVTLTGAKAEVPLSRRSLDTVRRRPSPMLLPEEAVDTGSLSDSAEPVAASDLRRPSLPIPPRRSLDTARHPMPSLTTLRAYQDLANSSAAKDRAQGGNLSTIRLQRPTELMRKGSSRDAIALGIDFDVKTIFESGEQSGDIYAHQYRHPQAQKSEQEQKPADDGQEQGNASTETSRASRQRQPQIPIHKQDIQRQASGPRSREDAVRSPKKNSSNIELRSKRSEASFKIALGPLREDRGANASSLKRSVTMPTRRPGGSSGSGSGSSGALGADGHAGQRSKWMGGNLRGVANAGTYAAGGHPRAGAMAPNTGYAAGWVGGVPENSWDHSSDEDSDAAQSSRRGAGTQTWYGPRSGIRPISMFPVPGGAALPVPPMPVLFGADDSDDDIDLEGDEGSSKTPALIGLGFGRGLRSHAASPNPSVRSRASSASRSVDRRRSNKLLLSPPPTAVSVVQGAHTLLPLAPSAVSSVKYDRLMQDTHGSRPRGRSDPEGRQSVRTSVAQAGSWSLSSGSAIDAAANKDRIQTPTVGSIATRQRSESTNPLLSGSNRPALTFSRNSRGAGTPAGAASLSSTPAEVAEATEYVPPPVPKKSGLAALLAGNTELRQNPFAEEFSLVGGTASGATSIELKMLLFYGDKRSKPFKVKVRQGVTVEQAIGFALYQYIDERRDPPLEENVQDVVIWALRIADDGEIDDDFPALDRTRPVAKFAFDEFILCLATPEQVRLNEGVRERQGKTRRMARPSPVAPLASAAAPAAAKLSAADRELRYTLAPRVESSQVILRPSFLATASTAVLFVGNSLQNRIATQIQSNNGSGAAPGAPATLVPGGAAAAAAATASAATAAAAAMGPFQSRLLKIHVLGEPSSAEALRTTTVNAGVDLPISQVLSHVCRKWAFSEDEYVLGILDKPGLEVLGPDMLIVQIPQDAELCLYRAGGPLPSLESLARARQPAPAPLFGQQPQANVGAEAESVVLGSGDATPSLIYRTFPVIRRAQMFARHERSLVIDGEVVTLMPSDHRTDSTKTLTFHISNITCKRNQRSPKKVKLLINRRGNTGEKSLDLEAMSEEDAMHICTIINRLHQRHVYQAVV